MAGAGALAGHPARLDGGGGLQAGWLARAGSARARPGWRPTGCPGCSWSSRFGAAVAVSLAFACWAARPGAVGRRGLGASYALTLGAVAVIITAADAFTFLLAWELLTVGFYLLAGFERGRPGGPAGALVTLAFGKISGAALLVGLLLLAVRSGSLNLASFAHVPARRGPRHRAGPADRRFRGQGGARPVPGLAAARLRGRARAGPGGHGRGRGQRRLLRPVARPWPCSARRPPG